MPANYMDLQMAFELVNSGYTGEYEAYVCRRTGKVHVHSESDPELEELPDDIDDEEKYVPLPGKRDLDLGKPLVLDFARQFLPDDYDEVRRIFSSKGAYGRFKSLLARRHAVDRWHDFQNGAEERALREWCKLNSIELSD